jgi:hypothetical protein
VRIIEKSETPFRLAVAAIALLLALAIVRLRFCHDVSVPPLPPRPQPRAISVVEAARTFERSPAMYAEYLARDAAAFAVEPAPRPADMTGPLVHRAEDVRLSLDPADKKKNRGEALGLVFTATVAKIEGTPDRQILLSIENTSDRHLAYRVATRPSRGVTPCNKKSDLAHNAVALAPGATERRSECLWNKGWTLTIERVEVIELPPLSFHYVSLLPAGAAIGLDARTGRGHRSPDREPLCRLFHSAEIENQLRSGVTTWRDVIDFYARHRCKTYTFTPGYRAVQPGVEISLPAAPEGG